MYRAPCWTNRILTFFLFISLQLSLPYIRGVKLRANPPDLAGAYRTRLGLSTCISALQGPGRHSFLPPHTHALFLTPFFFFLFFLFVNCYVVLILWRPTSCSSSWGSFNCLFFVLFFSLLSFLTYSSLHRDCSVTSLFWNRNRT